MNNQNLKQKAVSSIVWTSIQKFSGMGIKFVSGIILARLLTPYDYGCIGMLAIFVVLAEAFIDGGFGSALIQKMRPTQEDYSTIFWWSLLMAAILYGILYASAPLIAGFYKMPLLSDVLRVYGIVLFIYAFNVVQQNQLQKQLNFKVLSIVTLISYVVSLGVTVIMAYKGYGVWALVAQYLFVSGLSALAFWCLVKWRPKMVFSWNSFKELFNFGFFMFLTNLINRFGLELQGLLIGRYYDASTMGYYSKAQRTQDFASASISSVMTQVTFPLYSELQNDRQAMSIVIKRITMTLAYLSFPILFIFMLLAKPLFIILYSEKWLPSVPYFQVLCFAGLAGCLQAVNFQSISAIGKSRTLLEWTVIKRIVGIVVIILGLLWFGMKGLLAGVVFNYWFSYIINICLVSRFIGYKWYQQIKDLLPIAIASVIIAIICFLFGEWMSLGVYINALIQLIVYIILYLGWSRIFKPDAYTYFKSFMPNRLKIK